MNDFPEEFLKFLDDSRKHLAISAISQFVNSSDLLTVTELEFIGEHLNKCKNCTENLNNIFDEALEKNKTTFEINVNLSTKNLLNFTDNEKQIDGIISKENNEFYLSFLKLPSYLENENIRISLASENLIIRITPVNLNKKYKIDTDNDIDLRDSTKVNIDFIIKHVKRSVSLKNKVYKYWYIYTSVIFLIIYLIISQSVENNPTHPSEEYKPKPKIIIDTPVVKKDSVAEIDTVITKEEIAEIPKTPKTPPKTKLAPEFKNNSRLESLVDKFKDNGIIINPGIGDTLKKQIYFKWAPLETETYDMSIVDNKDNEMWSKKLFDTRVTLLQKLDPGVYYWKLTVKGKLQSVGKFYVK